MTYDRSIFKDYTVFDSPQKVCLGDGHVLDAVGIGKVEITTLVSRNKPKPNTMYDVLHVPEMKANLFSVRAAAMKGVIVQFGHTKCWLKNKQGKLRATGTVHNKLYYLDTDSVHHQINVACDLWHQCLGHASEQAIQSAHRNDLIEGAETIMAGAVTVKVLESDAVMTF